MKTLKSILSLTIAATLSACAFSKEDPNKDKTDSGVAGQQGPIAKSDLLNLRIEAAPSFHKFNVILEWEKIENCIPRLQKENLTLETMSWLPVSENPNGNGIYSRIDDGQTEGHKIRYTLLCLNSAMTALDTEEVQLPWDLVITSTQSLEAAVSKMGITKSDDQSINIKVERFAMMENSVLETSSQTVKIEFKRANFDPKSVLKNHISNRLNYDQAEQAGYLGRAGATISLIGDSAMGYLTFDRKGSPGRHGETGQDADQSLRPEKNPAAGNNASYAFELKPKLGGVCGGAGRGGKDFRRPDPCESLVMKCARAADPGPTGLRGFPGGRGGQAHPGGNTGKVFIKVKDRTNLVINQTARGGAQGIPGQGGNGGPGGEPGTPGQSLWLDALRSYMGMAPAPQDSDAKVMDRTGIRTDPCPPPSVGSVGQNGPQGPEGARSIDGLVEPIFVWDPDANSYLEWRTN